MNLSSILASVASKKGLFGLIISIGLITLPTWILVANSKSKAEPAVQSAEQIAFDKNITATIDELKFDVLTLKAEDARIQATLDELKLAAETQVVTSKESPKLVVKPAVDSPKTKK